ncbi:MAG: hypothetical protein IPG04_40835 [Polyangiaceae bacterium]|nr:hypothetical protein [Polyangiaceae bacterium]
MRFGARDYDPETGRWPAKDPIRLGGWDQLDRSTRTGIRSTSSVSRLDPGGLSHDQSYRGLLG